MFCLLPVILLPWLAHLCATASASPAEQCYTKQHTGLIVNASAAFQRRTAVMQVLSSPSQQACLLNCCSREAFKCNWAVYKFNKPPSSENCYLFHCATEEDCPLIPMNGVNSYNILKDLNQLTASPLLATTPDLKSTSVTTTLKTIAVTQNTATSAAVTTAEATVTTVPADPTQPTTPTSAPNIYNLSEAITINTFVPITTMKTTAATLQPTINSTHKTAVKALMTAHTTVQPTISMKPATEKKVATTLSFTSNTMDSTSLLPTTHPAKNAETSTASNVSPQPVKVTPQQTTTNGKLVTSVVQSAGGDNFAVASDSLVPTTHTLTNTNPSRPETQRPMTITPKPNLTLKHHNKPSRKKVTVPATHTTKLITTTLTTKLPFKHSTKPTSAPAKYITTAKLAGLSHKATTRKSKSSARTAATTIPLNKIHQTMSTMTMPAEESTHSGVDITTARLAINVLERRPLDTSAPSASLAPARRKSSQWGALRSGLEVAVVVGLVLLGLAVALLGRRALESFNRRQYTRLELNDLYYDV